ncbi:MAG: hypothetical protein RL702_2790 [Pseudomonadota bacterium]|jgi:hypothetical protein
MKRGYHEASGQRVGLGFFRIGEQAKASMGRKAVGFYWSLPVPWAGFTKLDRDIEIAAKQSRTIAYQRALVRDYARRQGMALIHEEAFLEIKPDRGSEQIVPALEKATKLCRAQGAELLYVSFAGVQQWRNHHAMEHWLAQADIVPTAIEAEPILVEGKPFDPFAHFSDWRERQTDWTEGKEERANKARDRASELLLAGLKKPAVAQLLNDEGLRSLTGKPWTADSLRKFLATHD